MVWIDLLVFGIMAGIYYDRITKMIFPIICAILLGVKLIGDF